jgi:hypothetical protein
MLGSWTARSPQLAWPPAERLCQLLQAVQVDRTASWRKWQPIFQQTVVAC